MRQQDTTTQVACLKKDEVYKLLKSRILSGEYPQDYRFPTEPEFAKELGVSRVTLRSAIEKLEGNGLVRRFHGKGTFVSLENAQKKGVKKFLILIYDSLEVIQIQHPTTYILPSIIKSCDANNIDTDILSISFLNSLPEEHAFNVLDKAGYDGVILSGSFYLGTEKEVRILKAINKPVVLPHAQEGDNVNTGFATLRTDSKQAWIDALKHLMEQGHRNILTLCTASTTTGPSLRGLRGFAEKEYLDFLASLGGNPDPGLLHFIPYNYNGLTKLLSEIFGSRQAPSAILCYSDFYAMSVYDSLNSLSLKIPEDVAVMGYCGYPGAHIMQPPLSTIDFDYDGIGKTSVKLLNSSDKWFNKDGITPPCIISPHKLIVRESTKNKRG